MHIWELKIVKAKIKIWKSVKGLTRKMEETAKESVRMKRPNLKNREKADWKKWTKPVRHLGLQQFPEETREKSV